MEGGDREVMILPDRKSIITITNPQPFPPPRPRPARLTKISIFRENSCRFEGNNLLPQHLAPPGTSVTPLPPSENIISSEHQMEETEANTTITDKLGDGQHSKENSS